MTADPFTCHATDSVEQALQLMVACRVRRLPVVDQRGKIVGLISLTDILETLKHASDLDIPLMRRTVTSVRKISRPRQREVPIPIPVAPGASPPPA
jgi:CBS domain-containing protein